MARPQNSAEIGRYCHSMSRVQPALNSSGFSCPCWLAITARSLLKRFPKKASLQTSLGDNGEIVCS